MPSPHIPPPPLAQSQGAPQPVHVAVVIVSFRTAALTIEALRSLEQERSGGELQLQAFVIDNDSGDFPAIARAIEENRWSSWASVHAAPRNGGFAYGNNLGFELAFDRGRPEYLYLLNPDAQVRPGAVRTLVQFMQAHPQVGIAGSGFENEDGSEWPIAFRFPSLMSEINSGLQFAPVSRLLRRWVVARVMTQVSQPVDWISGASMLIRADVIASVGGLDENYFLYFEETDFCFRARRAGFPTWYVPASRVMHISGQSTSVTDRKAKPRRLPGYWFESRRRYFAATYGVPLAMVIDLVAFVAYSLGVAKSALLARREQSVPHFVRDLLRHSILWSANRQLPPARCFKAPQKSASTAAARWSAPLSSSSGAT
jgi:N-acetylglucosaminyl-diphospho-decaprenol L-rhamnosyltransferase